MAEQIIKVSSKEKSTSIRLSETTKKMLDALAAGKETHEEILLRLIKMAHMLSSEQGTQIVERKNILGTKYERIHKAMNIETNKNKYNVVCIYNDLSIFVVLRSRQLARNMSNEWSGISDWEVDLDIVNIQKNNGAWKHPSTKSKEDKLEYLLLYLVALKQILEETFDVKLYELTIGDDFFSFEKWEKGYKRNNLSRASYYSDVEKKLDRI